MTKSTEITLARGFLDHAYALVEGGDDTIYELLDPTCKYGTEFIRRLNVFTVKEILALGFKAKYGEDWHDPVQERKSRPARWVGAAYHYAVCAKCGGQVSTGFETTDDAVAGWQSLYPFCPHCGTRMQSSEYDGPGAKQCRSGSWKGRQA